MMKQFLLSTLILGASIACGSSAKASPHPETLLAPLLGPTTSVSNMVERTIPVENRAKAIALMEENYGPPVTRRDGTLVWDVQNSQSTASRSPIVTVMMSFKKAGETVMIIDDRATQASSKAVREALSGTRTRGQTKRAVVRPLSTRKTTASDENDLATD